MYEVYQFSGDATGTIFIVAPPFFFSTNVDDSSQSKGEQTSCCSPGRPPPTPAVLACSPDPTALFCASHSKDLLDLHAGEKMTQEERIKLTALRVGLNTPELYDSAAPSALGGGAESPRPAAT